MGNRKSKSIHQLAADIRQFEDKKKNRNSSDFTDLKTFLSSYMNTPETKQRKRLAEEFRKRHMELYQFLKDNPALLSAETEITAMMQAAASGCTEHEDQQITNLLEMIQEGFQ